MSQTALHTIIFMAVTPKPDARDIHYDAFLNAAGMQLRETENVVRIARNIWQINIQRDIAAFAKLVSLADTSRVSYRHLAFDEVPRWFPE